MTTYNASTVSNTAIASGKPITLQQGRALRDNLVASREGATSAPYEQSAWHPYDGITIGDGSTGLIYDFGVHGVVSYVETPNFADGYEYRIRLASVSHNSGSSQTLLIDLYAGTTAAYIGPQDIVAAGRTNAQKIIGYAEILEPRRFNTVDFGVHYMTTNTGSGLGGSTGYQYFAAASPQKILKTRLTWSAGSFDAGKIFLDRRLCYA